MMGRGGWLNSSPGVQDIGHLARLAGEPQLHSTATTNRHRRASLSLLQQQRQHTLPHLLHTVFLEFHDLQCELTASPRLVKLDPTSQSLHVDL